MLALFLGCLQSLYYKKDQGKNIHIGLDATVFIIYIYKHVTSPAILNEELPVHFSSPHFFTPSFILKNLVPDYNL